MPQNPRWIRNNVATFRGRSVERDFGDDLRRWSRRRFDLTHTWRASSPFDHTTDCGKNALVPRKKDHWWSVSLKRQHKRGERWGRNDHPHVGRARGLIWYCGHDRVCSALRSRSSKSKGRTWRGRGQDLLTCGVRITY